jgi:hypothetical protein
MLSQLLLLFSAIIFFFIGRYSMGSSEIENAIKKTKRMLSKNKGMVIDYPSAEEIEYQGSEREKIDRQQTELIKNAGIKGI